MTKLFSKEVDYRSERETAWDENINNTVATIYIEQDTDLNGMAKILALKG